MLMYKQLDKIRREKVKQGKLVQTDTGEKEQTSKHSDIERSIVALEVAKRSRWNKLIKETVIFLFCYRFLFNQVN